MATDDLANNAVTSDKIKDGEVTSADVADGSITSTDIAEGTIPPASGGTPDDNSVTSAKIADGAVTSADIGDGQVTIQDLANGAVTRDKIANDAVQLNVRTLSDTRTIPANSFGSPIAHCASAETVTGGGYVIRDVSAPPFGDTDVDVIASNPTVDNGWNVSIENLSGSDRTLTVFVRCASLTP